MDRRGQIDMGAVLTIIGVLVAIIVGGLVVSKIHEASEESLEGTGTNYENLTLNSSFTENTGDVPDDWDNVIAGDNLKNRYDNANNWVYCIRTDNGQPDCAVEGGKENGENTDNSYWASSILTITNTYDKSKSATLKASYRVIDNDNLQSAIIEVWLDDSSDNTLWYTENVTNKEASTFTAIENDVLDNCTGTGTWRVWLVTKVNPDNESPASSIEIAWDDVSLSIVEYEKSIGETTTTDIGDIAGTIFTILAVLVLAGIVLLLVWTFARQE